jgi:8-oxo-dGTP pyrophosphatase MutT (NUDIX family)
VSGLRDDALAALNGWQAPDPRQERLRREYVDHVRRHAQPAARSTAPDHLTAGALVLSADGAEVLLTLHAKARRWFHLGGHVEPQDTTLAGAALREATEESGVDGLRLDPVPLHLDAHTVGFCSGHREVRHLDVRFLAVAPPGARPTSSAESLEVRWWPVEALPTDAADMVEMVARALARVGSAPGGAPGRAPG